jgi:hypothetical protein
MNASGFWFAPNAGATAQLDCRLRVVHSQALATGQSAVSIAPTNENFAGRYVANLRDQTGTTRTRYSAASIAGKNRLIERKPHSKAHHPIRLGPALKVSWLMPTSRLRPGLSSFPHPGRESEMGSRIPSQAAPASP